MSDPSPTNAPANPDAAWRIQTILFAALIMSTLIYAGVLFTLLQQPASATPLSATMMLPVFGALAFLLLVAAFLLRRKLMPPLGDEPVRLGSSSDKLTDAQGAAVAKLFTANILAWAMSEAIAIFGLILGMTCRDLNLLFPFLALSWVSFGLNRPQREVLDRVISGAR